MKILGYDKGEKVLYIEKKDKMFYGEKEDISHTAGNTFEKVKDPILCKQIMEDNKLVDFNEAYNMGMHKLYKTINELDAIEDPIILNKKDDLQRIYEFMMGREQISFPLITNYQKNTAAEIVSDNIVYELKYGVNPFAIIITKKNSDEMRQTDRYPSEAITIRVGLMATSLGLEGLTYPAYSPQVELSDDRKTISYGVNFTYYASTMQEKEQEMLFQIESEKRKEKLMTYRNRFFSKINRIFPKNKN